MALQTINPATGALVREYEEVSDDALADAVTAAQLAFLEWRKTGFAERAGALRRAADALEARKDELAHQMAIEMGKPLAQGRAEAEKCAWVCRYYADNGAAFLGHEAIATEASKSFVTFQPIGVVLAVMPWNFPLWQVFRFAAPALMAGNAGLLKHSSNVCGTALSIEEILLGAGIPKGLFRTLLLPSGRVASLIGAPEIKAVTLTGSTPAGQSVAAKAGQLLKKTVLELGGSDPYLVLEDADLDLAATVCARGRLINTGQSCIAAKRFIVVDKCTTGLSNSSSNTWPLPKWAIPLNRTLKSVRWRGMIFGTRCIDRSRAASQRARAACSVARFRGGPAPIIRQPSLPR